MTQTIDSDSIFPFHSSSKAEALDVTFKIWSEKNNQRLCSFRGQLLSCKQITNESIFCIKENDLYMEKDNTMDFEVRWAL